MCSQYRVAFDPAQLNDFYFSGMDNAIGTPRHVLPHAPAPVLLSQDGELRFELMRFSLVPRWSRESRPKFATHNARIESVDQKASFKEAFVKRHCLVPISAFIEAAYAGPRAGNMLAFRGASEVHLAAGIWEEWMSPDRRETIRSFSILTHDPYPFVLEQGHDRSPIFVERAYWQEWLSVTEARPDVIRERLLAHRESPTLSCEIERPLKDGWQRRAPKIPDPKLL